MHAVFTVGAVAVPLVIMGTFGGRPVRGRC
jgi:hypothetical protein